MLRRIAQGERILLSHRGKAAARLEPLTAAPPPADLLDDPFLGIGRRATPSPKGKLNTPASIASSMAAAEVFMDSAGFLALWDAGDEHHAAAIRLQGELARKRRPFLTTDYVVDETVTLLLVRHSHNAAVDFLDTVERSEALRLEWIGPERFHAACALFRKCADKEWSFTDCVSFGTMRELRVRDAFTTDHHFKQAGFVPLLK